ncbi:MAG: N-acetylmuramic acid 6-phosphate etherase [Candidatus Eremiobacteraeota bacterium]|nr:N-acetylmuramic acid 6-phosphate etherase [Candidatus Eremiobacteraeota bacterium]
MTYDDLPETERAHPRSAGIDALDTTALVALLAGEQRVAVDAVLANAAPLAAAVDELVARVKAGGRVHYVGAGTSGRLATLDAAEMPPTFGTDPELVRAHVAGGMDALVRAIEGAEDDGDAGEAAIAAHVRAGDAVVGISASGGAAFVVRALQRARALGAYTVALVNARGTPLAAVADAAIAFDTGPELIAGSTRMKAGTAQKIALNALSTAIMVRLGKVHGHLMVDVVATNRKLRARALRLVRAIADVDEPTAHDLLERAGGRVKVAVVMHRHGVDAQRARELLARHDGVLRPLL